MPSVVSCLRYHTYAPLLATAACVVARTISSVVHSNIFIRTMTEPFDPFSYDEEDYDEPSKAATDGTSKTTNTTNKRRQQQPIGQGEGEQALSLEELPLQLSSSFSANKRLPPRLNVKLSYHEEVSSNSIEEKGKSLGGSLSRLFVTGKIMVST